MADRIQKKLAQAGIASRREIERMMVDGRIVVNDKPAELGQTITRKDRIKVDGKPVRIEFENPATEILLYHKPQGEIVARQDPEERKLVFDNVPEPKHGRWVAIGRLDINTSGLLLFTNNGELAHRLMHPSYEIVRGYAVRVLGEASDIALKQLRLGVELEDGPAKFDSIESADGESGGVNHWYHVTLKEGRNREVRRLWEAVGLTVSRLSRVHFDVVQLPRELHRGQFQWASLGQVNRLLERVGLPVEEAPKPDADRQPGKKSPRNAPRNAPRNTSNKNTPRNASRNAPNSASRNKEGRSQNAQEREESWGNKSNKGNQRRSERDARPGKAVRTGAAAGRSKKQSAQRSGDTPYYRKKP